MIDVATAFPHLKILDADRPGLEGVKAYLKRAYATAQKSNDPNTHVGATLVTANPTGTQPNEVIYACNHIVGANNDSTRFDRPKKYDHVVHAEAGTILQAARYGKRTEGAFMYAPWFACIGCAQVIGEAGIRQVVGHLTPFQLTPPSWVESIQKGHDKLVNDYGIELYAYTGTIGITVKMDGKVYSV